MITDYELLHRAIKPMKLFWNEKTKRITSALFKDSHGVSVDINADRTNQEIQDDFLLQFPDLIGDANLITELCRSRKCRVESSPVEGNENHALILGENKVQLTSGVAKYLARNCNITKYDL